MIFCGHGPTPDPIELTSLTWCAIQVGDFEKALADYGQALQVDPHNSFAHYNRGITRDRLGDFAGAVEDFSAAISIDASNADFHHNRGFSLRKQVCTCTAMLTQEHSESAMIDHKAFHIALQL